MCYANANESLGKPRRNQGHTTEAPMHTQARTPRGTSKKSRSEISTSTKNARPLKRPRESREPASYKQILTNVKIAISKENYFSYLMMVKKSILPGTEAGILLNFFREAFIFTSKCHIRVQCETDQATLHCLQHTAITVHSFISSIIHRLVCDDLPHLKEVYYFNDDSRLQYKNCKHVLNLYCHEDFHVAAEWNFFATSHSKSLCNEIGGTVK
jgi:hypothetical protein